MAKEKKSGYLEQAELKTKEKKRNASKEGIAQVLNRKSIRTAMLKRTGNCLFSDPTCHDALIRRFRRIYPSICQ